MKSCLVLLDSRISTLSQPQAKYSGYPAATSESSTRTDDPSPPTSKVSTNTTHLQIFPSDFNPRVPPPTNKCSKSSQTYLPSSPTIPSEFNPRVPPPALKKFSKSSKTRHDPCGSQASKPPLLPIPPQFKVPFLLPTPTTGPLIPPTSLRKKRPFLLPTPPHFQHPPHQPFHRQKRHKRPLPKKNSSVTTQRFVKIILDEILDKIDLTTAREYSEASADHPLDVTSESVRSLDHPDLRSLDHPDLSDSLGNPCLNF